MGASYFAYMSFRQGQTYKIRLLGFKCQLLLLILAEDIHISHNVCLVTRNYLCSRYDSWDEGQGQNKENEVVYLVK